MKDKGRILLLGIPLFTIVMISLLLQTFVVQPQTARSLFKGDTCSPPCWFGLIPDKVPPSNSVLRIYNGVFDSISVNLNREVTYGEMLAILGRSDVLRLGLNGYGFTYMIAIYENARLSVFIDMNPFLQAHVETNEPCTLQDPANSFFVDGLDYFSPQAAQEIVTPIEGDRVPQPQLFVRYLHQYDVSPEILSSWLNGEETADCRTVWQWLAQAQATATP